jgi:putative hydrolase of the HAD superfamily
LDGRKIQAVLFDLGETLILFGRLRVHEIFDRAARFSYDYLRNMRQPVGSYRRYWLWNFFGIRLRLLGSFLTGNDFDSLTTLREYGRKKGFNLTEAQWEELNWQWYRPLAEQGCIEPQTENTLKILSRAGLKLGILSNTFIHSSSLDRHLKEAGLLDYFDLRLYSYQFSFRKPDRRIFLEAARRIGTEPSRIVFVGDRMDKDVRGARNAGMIPVLKHAYTNKKKDVPGGVFRIQSIAELPELIETLNRKE